ncbi:MAG TPA: hypothetical protein PKV96_03300 [Candidatus Saccharimonas sp.]|jgi:hypothetical protein|nr:hypothetical protein [Candidatus Saccharimonas sp.]
MNIRSKSPAHLEAQLGDYVSKAKPGFGANVKFGAAISSLLPLAPDEFGKYTDFVAPCVVMPKTELDEFARGYIPYLRRMAHGDRMKVRNKADLVANYEVFAEHVTTFLETRRGTRLGSGAFSFTYRLSCPEGVYALRIPSCLMPEREIDKHLDAAVRVRDIGNIEHIVAASYATGVTVAEFVPGAVLDECSNYILGDIPQSAYDECYQSLLTAQSRGVGFDCVGSNLMYDEAESKFTMIDVGLPDKINGNADRSLYVNICNRFDSVMHTGIENGNDYSDVQILLDMLSRLRRTLMYFSPDSPVIDDIVQLVERMQFECRGYLEWAS